MCVVAKRLVCPGHETCVSWPRDMCVPAKRHVCPGHETYLEALRDQIRAKIEPKVSSEAKWEPKMDPKCPPKSQVGHQEAKMPPESQNWTCQNGTRDIDRPTA